MPDDPNGTNRQTRVEIYRGAYEEPHAGRFRRSLKWIFGLLLAVIMVTFVLDLTTGIGMFSD